MSVGPVSLVCVMDLLGPMGLVGPVGLLGPVGLVGLMGPSFIPHCLHRPLPIAHSPFVQI